MGVSKWGKKWERSSDPVTYTTAPFRLEKDLMWVGGGLDDAASVLKRNERYYRKGGVGEF